MKRILLCLTAFMMICMASCGQKTTGSIIAPTFPIQSVTPSENGQSTPSAAPTVTDSTTPTDLPVLTDTPAPTDTPVPTDTSTPTPEPATPTPKPATPTPKPATPTPKPATPTPKPATPTPKPATPTPKPTGTPSPVPTRAADHDGKFIVVLDPGHGGSWTGAVSGKYVEAQINLKIAKYCKEYIEAHYPSITVYMTRTDSNVFSKDLATDLAARVQFANDLNADAIVSLHLNASGNGSARGCLICTQHRASVKDGAAALGTRILEQLEALGINSKSMTNGIRKGLYYRYSSDRFDENGKAKEYYQICRNAADVGLIGIIVEHCFIDNKEDSVYFSTDEAIRKLGEADAKGIAAYFGVKDSR